MSDKPCTVSVIVPFFNAEDYLEECIRSVLEQSRTDFELLVINDGSTDSSVQIATELAAQDSRVNMFSHPNSENRGVSRSRQLGISHAQGKYVAFLDADDVFEKEKLETQLAAIEKAPECVMSHTGVSVMSAEDEFGATLDRHFNAWKEETEEYNFLECENYLQQNHICNPTVIVKTDVLQNLVFGIPQLFQYEDWTLWILLACRGPFLYIPDRLTRYRLHPASATSLDISKPIRVNYAKIEMLLSTMAYSQDDRVSQDCEKALVDLLRDLIVIYTPQVESSAAQDSQAFSSQGIGQSIIRSQSEEIIRVRQDADEVERLREELRNSQEEVRVFQNHPLLAPFLRIRRVLKRLFGVE